MSIKSRKFLSWHRKRGKRSVSRRQYFEKKIVSTYIENLVNDIVDSVFKNVTSKSLSKISCELPKVKDTSFCDHEEYVHNEYDFSILTPEDFDE